MQYPILTNAQGNAIIRKYKELITKGKKLSDNSQHSKALLHFAEARGISTTLTIIGEHDLAHYLDNLSVNDCKS